MILKKLSIRLLTLETALTITNSNGSQGIRQECLSGGSKTGGGSGGPRPGEFFFLILVFKIAYFT